MSIARFVVASLLVLGTLAAPAATSRVTKKPVIQVAVLLDTSSSMNGLIDQARTQLWRIVNELATARRQGMTPDLRVALYEYGNDRLPAERGYIRRVLPLTSDLDKISEELFALSTGGGQEYCGQTIDQATKELAWSASNGDLKLIFIAGNEAFTQGSVDFREACKRAIAKGIVVNTIFCGPKQEGIDTQWKDGADLADGSFLSIDHNAKVADIPAPQDKEIASLGEQLNKTYIAFGKGGTAGLARQSAQDLNAAAAPSANVQRQIAKASGAYMNSSWDLIDAKNAGQIDLDKVDPKDLPAEMQKMTPAERKAHVDKSEKKRVELQAKMRTLESERKKYIAQQMKQHPPAASTLDGAVISAVHKVGVKNGYTFK